ncbi:MAG: 4-(cytidine 5'-diphospho)-2-C-methyl-D-erythritol kinase [Candidatus Gastranaerophilales bacterium]|nr:4-(cytidine 5'-diphospho)-2-C-methyl-D-erythritol kinase [Candidatus Gastranaerophilales bacterium]
MQKIKVKTPAKINLTLDIKGKRADGFHEISSIMQAISLFDYLTIEVNNSTENQIILSGNSAQIPYDKTNLAYKACQLFLDEAKIQNKEILINIEKNIPIAAGLAGGSSNAAGVLWGLNKIFDNILSKEKIDNLASKLGSDVNFCLYGGTQSATSKGEILQKLSTPNFKIILVNPNIHISAKEAYQRHSELETKPQNNNSKKMIEAINNNNPSNIAKCLSNNLESSILPNYSKIQELKILLKQAGCINTLMSGSGSTVFGIYENNINLEKFDKIWIYNAQTIDYGVSQ